VVNTCQPRKESIVEQQRIEAVTRTLSSLPSRRDVLRGLAAAGLGFSAPRLAETEAAKHKHKKGKKRKHRTPVVTPPEVPPLVFNRYGCLDVGQPCRGENANCCSGICQGAAPAAGQPDASHCVAHNAGVCTPETDSCELGLEVPCNPSATRSACTITTGNAGFCADISAGTEKHCRVCTRDTDCQGEFGPGAACVVLGGGCTPLCITTGRTACIPSAA